MMITPELNNEKIEELIRDYFSFNKYYGALETLISESSNIGDSSKLTRNAIIESAKINPTS